ncbi:MAG: FtsW/RodA/SpoVE family cell cycle protein, partial [Gammaproteobacteria bacterium]|nr:FtsW/RodA/SpoVE family cell cycle protein [Gammaproteobacteria bacterium]
MSAAPQAIPARPVNARKDVQDFGLDHWLLGAVLTLLSIGLVMVYSTTVATGEFAGSTHYLFLQSTYIAFGLFLMWLVSRIEIDWWRSASRVLLIVAAVLLLLVLIPAIGVEVNGSRRWLPLGPIRVQASEVAKLCILIYAADYLARKTETLQKFKDGIVNLAIIIGVASALMLLEPDLGSTVVVAAMVFGMMFLAGVRITHFGFCLLIGIALVAVLT